MGPREMPAQLKDKHTRDHSAKLGLLYIMVCLSARGLGRGKYKTREDWERGDARGGRRLGRSLARATAFQFLCACPFTLTASTEESWRKT